MNQKRIKELLHLAKIRKRQREKNESQLWSKAKYKEAVKEFHEPILKRDTVDLKKIDYFKDTDNALQSLQRTVQAMPTYSSSDSLAELPSPGRRRYTADNLDEGLDLMFISQNGLKPPSEIVAQPEVIEEMLRKCEGISKNIGSLKGKIIKKIRKETDPEKKHTLQENLDLYDSSLNYLKTYREKLKVLRAGAQVFNIRGEGLLSELSKLTDILLSGNKSKKLHNQIVDILDLLRLHKAITSQNVEDYYKKFLLG